MQFRFLSSLAGLLLFFCLATGASAQNTITITGKVLDSNGEPAISATVIGNDREAGTQTDMDGMYEITLTVRDSVKLMFQYADHKVMEIYITNPTESTYTRDVQLEPFSTTTIVVTTEGFRMSAGQVTSSMSVIETERVDRMASTDLVSTISQESGITIYDEQPSIRGSSGYTYGAGSRVLTLLNGLPMISADRASVNFDMLPTDNIQQIEVFKGASSVLYGAGAMGGVINVITADPADTPRTVVRVGTSLYDNPRNDSVNWDGRSTAFSPNIAFFHSRRMGNFDFTTLVNVIKQSGYRQEEFSDRLRMMVMAKYHILRNTPTIKDFYIGLNAQFNVDSSASFIAWSSYPTSVFNVIYDNQGSFNPLVGPRDTVNNVLARGALVPGPGFLSYQLLYRYSIDPTVAVEFQNGSSITYRGRWFRNVNEISTGQSGSADLIYNDLQYARSIGRFIQLVGGLNYTLNKVKADSTFGEAIGTQYSAFLQARIRVGTKLNFVLGARYQNEQMVGDTSRTIAERGTAPRMEVTTINQPIFRAGVNYQAALGTFFRASFGQGVRSPSVAERFTTTQAGPINVIPAPNINIETGWTAEIGARQLYSFGKVRGFLDVAAFVMEFKDMVEFYADVPTLVSQQVIAFNAQNVSDASIRGVEANYNIQVPVNDNWGIYLTAGFTYTNPIDRGGNKNYDGDDSLSVFTNAAIAALLGGWPDGAQFPIDRPHTLKYRNKWLVRSSLELYYKRWSFTTNYRYTSQMVNVDKLFMIDFLFPGVTTFRSRNNSGWHEFDFILAYNLPAVSFSLHSFNAFNTEFMTIPGTLGEQRRWALQMKFTF